MASQPLARHFQRILLAFFLLFCFGGVFYSYYKPTLNWISCPGGPVSIQQVCTSECLTALVENLTQPMNNTSIVNYTLVKQQQKTITKPVVIEDIEENEDTLMLIWSWPFVFKFNVKACSSMYGIKGCKITLDRSQYEKAHGVMFHHKNIGGDFTNLLKTPRPPFQKWVWVTMESPDNSRRNARLNNVFNLTSNYRRDSDVWVPYGRIIEASENDKIFKIPPKDKLVCWVVSNWNPNFRRVKYFNELRQYIQIEAYGRHFGRHISHEDYDKILSNCKFYLSFENSIYKDYITEKVFNPMKAGTVPVVLGPPRENYEEFIPADSFIHVDDFKSPKELAERLTYLDQHQEVYEQYFTWRQFFTPQHTYIGLEHACRSCDSIRRNKGYKVFKNLNKWYWG